MTLIGLEYLKTITGILKQKIIFEWCERDRLSETSDTEILMTTPGEHWTATAVKQTTEVVCHRTQAFYVHSWSKTEMMFWWLLNHLSSTHRSAVYPKKILSMLYSNRLILLISCTTQSLIWNSNSLFCWNGGKYQTPLQKPTTEALKKRTPNVMTGKLSKIFKYVMVILIAQTSGMKQIAKSAHNRFQNYFCGEFKIPTSMLLTDLGDKIVTIIYKPTNITLVIEIKN